jgi:hypothetical protein
MGTYGLALCLERISAKIGEAEGMLKEKPQTEIQDQQV